jgi:hypothetical protein
MPYEGMFCWRKIAEGVSVSERAKQGITGLASRAL